MLPIFQLVSSKLRFLRERKKKLAFCVQSLIRTSGEQWQKGPNQYKINTQRSRIYIINGLLEIGLNAVGNLVKTLLQGKSPSLWFVLKEPLVLASMLGAPLPPMLTKQRSTDWFVMRKAFYFTGSTVSNACGFSGLKCMASHFAEKQYGVKPIFF